MTNAPSWDRVKQVFQEALARPPHERAACLQQMCGEDRALRAEVESLLATHQQAGSFADRPALELLDELALGWDSQTFASVGRVMRAGDRLGAYEIQSLLGSGGMGDVYKARDTRLDRLVAIKVLPADLASDGNHYQRFEREARAVASLDHPHIGALYDVGQEDGLRFLVMQYLEGETLASRLASGALPTDQVLRYAIEIAGALDHAHRRGIVHRDVKPGNIFLTKAGTRLLDFGVAKWRAVAATGAVNSLSAHTNASGSLTEEGMIVGTLHYMAPEQLEGKAVDARADLFAFGAVLYEMTTGRRAFEGTSPASVMAAVLDSEPPSVSTLQHLAPAALDHLVKICLAKDPDERWQTAGDLKRQLMWIAKGDVSPGAATASAPRGRRRERVVIGLLALVVTALVVGVTAWTRRPPVAPRSVTRAVLPLGPDESLVLGLNPVLAVSPEGTRLVYVAAHGDGRPQLHLRALNQLSALPVAGTEGAYHPFFSPDGRWVGFFADGKMKKVPVSGGPLVTICDVDPGADGARGASWGWDDTILLAPSFHAGLSRVSAGGGNVRPITALRKDRRERSHRFPHLLPGGKAALFTVGTADIEWWDDARIEIVSLETGERRVLIDGGTSARYSPSGHIVFARAGSLLAAPFDLARLEVSGPSATVVDGVKMRLSGGSTDFDLSTDGMLVYLAGFQRPAHRLLWVDRQGHAQPLMAQRDDFYSPRLSHDGQRLAVAVSRANDEVWIYDFVRDALERRVFGWQNTGPAWTPDGARITFLSSRDEMNGSLFWQVADGSRPAEALTTLGPGGFPGSWSPDGQTLAFSVFERDPTSGGWDIWMLALQGERRPRPLVQTRFAERNPKFSPDGRWLAYDSKESGVWEVYVMQFPPSGERWQVSTDGGIEPAWGPDGRELFYRGGRAMMKVGVETKPTFKASRPAVLFTPRSLAAGGSISPDYDVSPDGNRFVMIEEGEPGPAPAHVNLVVNWTEELKQRVPTR